MAPYEQQAMVGIHQDDNAQDPPSLGIPRRKRSLEKSDLLVVLGSLLCLAAAIVTVSPSTSVPWRLGITHQFQVIGFLMSLMNQFSLSIAPRFLTLIEARFGSSYLQNFDAILRKSVTTSETSIFWRAILVALLALPMGLSVAYKEFIHGFSHFPVANTTGSFYGLTGPLGLQKDDGNGQGLSFMANATTEYYNTAINANSTQPTFPQAFGFNTLLLSNESSAKLDGPYPDYVQAIQARLTTTDAFLLDTNVNGTVTTYNNSIESHRNDTDFWDSYLSDLPQNPDDDKTTFDDIDLAEKLVHMNLYIGQHLDLLMNSLEVRNTSWAFISFTPTPPFGMSKSNRKEKLGQDFRHSAMLFHTRRERCHGTWRITYNSVQLENGTCDQQSLPDDAQLCFTNSTLAIPQFYMASIAEYLLAFADERRQSPWLLPTFTTVLAGALWSRIVALNSYFTRKPNETADDTPLQQSFHYLVQDTATSVRPTMNAPLPLYITLMVQPALTIAFLIGCVWQRRTPIDKGFGLIALLSGVRVETLKLLGGASVSGKLTGPVRVQISARRTQRNENQGDTQNEYILEDPKIEDTSSQKGHVLPPSKQGRSILRAGLRYSQKPKRSNEPREWRHIPLKDMGE